MIESSKKERLVSPKSVWSDSSTIENSLRPKTLENYVWQKSIKKHLSVSISSAKIRKETLEHILFYGPPWLWKTTLSNIIAYEMWVSLKSTSGPAIEKQSDLISILSNLEDSDVLFIDEIHRLKPQIEEILYTAMEDFTIDIMVWSWTWAQSVKIPLKKFSLVWATTRLSSLSSPLRDRFWNVLKLDFYTANEIEKIIEVNSLILWLALKNEVLEYISKKSRWTPRIANRLLKVVRDYYTIWHDINSLSGLHDIFVNIWIDELWLDYLDRKYLETLYTKFSSGPVWLNTIAASIWEEEATLEDVVEPYLLQIWFLERTPRWRKITLNWEKHLNKKK